ncbi:hypothetical protein PR048_022416 [Dryococelus australis]|uniref:Uncharacterized protein n=1 Tax=Dryococelus australis TaxID=614101 RepID=A0ABQ9H0Y7_9NEOP|nr:hypothetical protein PR048_022416 [Dryococelus australis]
MDASFIGQNTPCSLLFEGYASSLTVQRTHVKQDALERLLSSRWRKLQRIAKSFRFPGMYMGVYQECVHDKDSKFHSFKKVSFEMGEPYKNIQMVSFHSVSKGYVGNFSGGYAEFVNLQPELRAMLEKYTSASQMCPAVDSQAVIDIMVHPPQPNEPSYEQFMKEKEAVLRSSDRTTMVAESFNSREGMSCSTVQGYICASNIWLITGRELNLVRLGGSSSPEADRTAMTVAAKDLYLPWNSRWFSVTQGLKKQFKETVKPDSGNWRRMGQSPITYVRQVEELGRLPVTQPLPPEDGIGNTGMMSRKKYLTRLKPTSFVFK